MGRFACARLLALSFVLPLASTGAFDYCDALRLLGSGAFPSYLGVISHSTGETSAWAVRLPIPFVVYSYGKIGSYTVKEDHGGPSSAYVSFIIDHYRCLPKRLLFLHDGSDGAWHPLDPASSSALVDLESLDAGFLALGHLSAANADALTVLHPASEGFSAHAPAHSHRAAFVATEEGRVGCECYAMRLVIGGLAGASGSLSYGAKKGVQCDRPFAWQPGATFWATERRVKLRPLTFWQGLLEVLLTDEDFRSEADPGGKTSFAAKCVESLWHFLLGQPLYHFQPLFEAFEELPLVDPQLRCRQSNASCAGAMAAVASRAATRFSAKSDSRVAAKAAAKAAEVVGKGRRWRLCSATHGEMDGDDVGVATYSGFSVEQRDHSCCSRCREIQTCEFWVRSTKTNDCWLRRNFKGYVDGSDRRGAFVSVDDPT